MSGDDDPRWQRVTDLAAAAGTDRRTVWRWVEKGLVEVHRLGPRTCVRVRMRTDPELRAHLARPGRDGGRG
jgi:hypothetical protein